jgi:hypothetical protein
MFSGTRSSHPSLVRLTILLSVLWGFTACGTTIQYVQTNPAPHPLSPKHPLAVEIYTTSAPGRPYVEVGILEAQQESGYSTDEMPAIINKMKNHAASVGCDALVIVGSKDKVVGNVNSFGPHSTYGSTTTLSGYRAACIVYK